MLRKTITLSALLSCLLGSSMVLADDASLSPFTPVSKWMRVDTHVISDEEQISLYMDSTALEFSQTHYGKPFYHTTLVHVTTTPYTRDTVGSLDLQLQEHKNYCLTEMLQIPFEEQNGKLMVKGGFYHFNWAKGRDECAGLPSYTALVPTDSRDDKILIIHGK